MAALRWLPEALADLDRLFEFLREKNPEAAARAARAILDGADLLATSPRIGRRMSDDTDRRELPVPFGAGAYIIRYILGSDETVIIIRAWHSREDRR
jgi:plasmid stabilization system protein ParE